MSENKELTREQMKELVDSFNQFAQDQYGIARIRFALTFNIDFNPITVKGFDEPKDKKLAGIIDKALTKIEVRAEGIINYSNIVRFVSFAHANPTAIEEHVKKAIQKENELSTEEDMENFSSEDMENFVQRKQNHTRKILANLKQELASNQYASLEDLINVEDIVKKVGEVYRQFAHVFTPAEASKKYKFDLDEDSEQVFKEFDIPAMIQIRPNNFTYKGNSAMHTLRELIDRYPQDFSDYYILYDLIYNQLPISNSFLELRLGDIDELTGNYVELNFDEVTNDFKDFGVYTKEYMKNPENHFYYNVDFGAWANHAESNNSLPEELIQAIRDAQQAVSLYYTLISDTEFGGSKAPMIFRAKPNGKSPAYHYVFKGVNLSDGDNVTKELEIDINVSFKII